MILEEARKLRKFIEKMAENISDEEAIEHIDVFPNWKVGVEYKEEDVNKARVRYNEVLYKVISPHISQADWTPDIAISLYVRVDDPSIEWPDWIQPQGAHDAYEFGSKVSHLLKEDGSKRHWISTYEGANVWEPSVFGWDEVLPEVEE